MKNIGQHMLTLPPLAPVMILPGATLFPQTLLPLHIFEPRYRAMLTWALERHRMFCVAMMKPGLSEAESTEDFHHVAGLGLVRACVARPDGTSDLVLQGLARVQFAGFVEGEPFRIAELQKLAEPSSPSAEAESLAGELRAFCAGLDGAAVNPGEQLAKISDPGSLADIVAQTLLSDPAQRQHILQEPNVGTRLRALIRYLKAESA